MPYFTQAQLSSSAEFNAHSFLKVLVDVTLPENINREISDANLRITSLKLLSLLGEEVSSRRDLPPGSLMERASLLLETLQKKLSCREFSLASLYRLICLTSICIQAGGIVLTDDSAKEFKLIGECSMPIPVGDERRVPMSRMFVTFYPEVRDQLIPRPPEPTAASIEEMVGQLLQALSTGSAKALEIARGFSIAAWGYASTYTAITAEALADYTRKAGEEYGAPLQELIRQRYATTRPLITAGPAPEAQPNQAAPGR